MSDDRTRVPNLPSDAYSGIVGEFVKLVNPTIQCPPEFLFGPFMAAFGASVPQVDVDWDADGLTLTTFTALLGPTGYKKGSAKRRAKRAIDTALVDVTGQPLATETGLVTAQGLLRVVGEASYPNGPGQPGVVPAAMFDLGEITGVFKQASGGNAPMIEVLLDGYDGLWNYSKTLSQKTDSTKVHRLRFSIVSDSVPEHLGSVLTAADIRSGLVNRFDFYMGNSVSPVAKPSEPDAAEMERLVLEPS